MVGLGWIDVDKIKQIRNIKRRDKMITCKVGDNIINCYDGEYKKEQLKKWSSKNILICPVCGKPYEYCHGEFISPYFRHKEKDICESMYYESESQEHINGKRDLFEWVKKQTGVTDAVLEGWLPKTKQRPDILFKWNGLLHVIEYQCSPISTEYYERHELYKACGIIDIWICGAEKYFQCYHSGNGTKRINVLENVTRKYYDSNSKMMFLIKSDFKKSKGINNMKEDFNLYKSNKINTYQLKDIGLNYTSYNRFTRNGWKTKSVYNSNKSIANCKKIDEIVLQEVN